MDDVKRPTSESRIQTFCLLVIAAVAMTGALYWLRGVLIPFVLAVFLTFIIGPIVKLQQDRFHSPRWLALAGTLLIFVLVAGGIGLLVSTSVQELTANADAYQQQFQTLLDRTANALPLESWGIDPENALGPILEQARGAVGGLLLGVMDAAVSLVSQGILVLIFMMFLILGSPPTSAPAGGMLRDVRVSIELYIGVKVLLSAITGIAVGVTLLILGVELALVFGLFAFLLNFIPSVGSIIATLLPLPVVLFSPNVGPVEAGLAIAIPGSIQMVVGNIIEPKMMGKSMTLHPVTILLALIFWGMVWGIIGMLLATPITAILRILLTKWDITAPVSRLMAGDLRDLTGDGTMAADG